MSEKTEEPTPRRLAKARERGDVPTSAALTSAASWIAATVLAPPALAATWAFAADALRDAIASGRGPPPATLATTTLTLTLPFAAGTAAVAAAVAGLQAGGVIAPARVAPDLTRLDPLAGLRRLLGAARAWAVVRALVTAAAVATLAWTVLREGATDVVAGATSPAAAATVAGELARRLAARTAWVLVALAAVDVVIARRAWRSKLRMTPAEVKREHRESEGDPQQKAARERAWHELSAAAVVAAVRDATVVIVNPEHLATALRWAEAADDAPVVVAQGAGDLAARMREAARAYGVPIVRDVPVARALRELEVGDAIPEALYEAVAEILREAWEASERGE